MISLIKGCADDSFVSLKASQSVFSSHSIQDTLWSLLKLTDCINMSPKEGLQMWRQYSVSCTHWVDCWVLQRFLPNTQGGPWITFYNERSQKSSIQSFDTLHFIIISIFASTWCCLINSWLWAPIKAIEHSDMTKTKPIHLLSRALNMLSHFDFHWMKLLTVWWR